MRRIPACLRALRVKTIGDAERELAERPSSRNIALDAMLIGTSTFFRDEQVFVRLRERLAARAQNGQEIRVWSAGCSDGMELISVALLLDDLGALSRARLLGTDCRPNAILRARRAEYDPRFVAVPPLDRSQFDVDRGKVRLAARLREHLRFEQDDLLRSRPEHSFDFILCRNLAIYLSPECAETLWRNLAAALLPGGWLVTGRSERVRLTTLTRIAPSIYERAQV